LLAKVDAHLRIKRLHDDLREDKGRLQAQQGQLSLGFEQLLSVLLYVLDLRIPGAEARGKRLAEFSGRVAERFGVPERFVEALKTAALLLELGRVIEQPDDAAFDTGDPLSITPGEWTYAVATQAVLQRVGYLEEAAEVVGVIYENWDGTGLPNRWRQGQIPLRSRIIRTLVDFFAALGDDRDEVSREDLDTALAKLSRYSGTLYDPMVLEHLAAVVYEDPQACLLPPSYRVPIGRLREGMVLARDLCTMGSIKLLAAGARVSARALDIIRQRHLSDPIVDGAWVAKER
jgi:response regulator RpfG family c-di-GMP phosphodiesterase